MKNVKTTKEVARILGIRPGSLHAGIYNNRIQAPPKNASGRYQWSDEEIEKARKVMTG